MNRLLTALLTMCLLSSCTSYIRQIPSFPECKILKVSMDKALIRPYQMARYTIWVNTAVDSVKVITIYRRDRNKTSLLVQRGRMYHTQSPVSGIEFDWMTNAEGDYSLEIEAWNRWSRDEYSYWLTVEELDVSRDLF